jgi:hypothetical protein
VFFLEPKDEDVVVAPAGDDGPTTYGDILHRNIITFPEYRHDRFRPLDLRLLRRHRVKPVTKAVGAFAVVDGRRMFDMSMGCMSLLSLVLLRLPSTPSNYCTLRSPATHNPACCVHDRSISSSPPARAGHGVHLFPTPRWPR